MDLKVFTDGGSIGNPGPSASAYIIQGDNSITFEESRYLGHSTNNKAEYTALVMALEKIKELIAKDLIKPLKISVFSDSNLLVSQVNGLYKVKNSDIRDFIMKIRILEQEIAIPITYSHVYREKNTEADALVKKELRKNITALS